ncbi:MAG: hypothetical protein MHM6MM_002329 [Cercozoa sp. M6MM]
MSPLVGHRAVLSSSSEEAYVSEDEERRHKAALWSPKKPTIVVDAVGRKGTGYSRSRLPVSMRGIDVLLRQARAAARVDDTAHANSVLSLLTTGIFNAKELTESVSALTAVLRHTDIPQYKKRVMAVSVGDGATPRTAAWAALCTSWQRIVSVDPILKEVEWRNSLVNPKTPLAQERIESHSDIIENVTIDVDASEVDTVVLFHVHAHVDPDVSLRSLRFSNCGDTPPRIVVVQLPCCDHTWRDKVCGTLPDVCYVDDAVASAQRCVRLWRDVSTPAFFGTDKRPYRSVQVADDSPCHREAPPAADEITQALKAEAKEYRKRETKLQKDARGKLLTQSDRLLLQALRRVVTLLHGPRPE